MNEKITEVTELRRRLQVLGDRVHRLEAALFRAVVAVGAAALVLGYFLPFLSATEKTGDEDETIALIPAIVGLGDAGDGPFSGEATMAAIVVGAFCLVILVALIALARLFQGSVSARTVRVARVCAIVLLVVCGFAWLLVFALAGHFEGRTSAFSPATFSITVGGAATLLAAALHPADWRD
jgi:Na+/proline symporter